MSVDDMILHPSSLCLRIVINRISIFLFLTSMYFGPRGGNFIQFMVPLFTQLISKFQELTQHPGIIWTLSNLAFGGTAIIHLGTKKHNSPFFYGTHRQVNLVHC